MSEWKIASILSDAVTVAMNKFGEVRGLPPLTWRVNDYNGQLRGWPLYQRTPAEEMAAVECWAEALGLERKKPVALTDGMHVHAWTGEVDGYSVYIYFDAPANNLEAEVSAHP